MVGKVYGNERMIELTKEGVSEKQESFRKGRGCVEEVFTLRMIIEKLREKDKQWCMNV